MKVIDLTHTISENMPVYPGTETPKLKCANTIEADGFRETLLEMYSHTGTHADSPAHIFDSPHTLDSFELGDLCGRAVMLDCRNIPENGEITKEMLLSLGKELSAANFLILYTGWEKKWGTDEYYNGFPVLSAEAAEYVASLNLRGVGVDAISVDKVGVPLEIHKILLSKKGGFVIVENLCNLSLIRDRFFGIAIMPLKFENADGAPVRVAAFADTPSDGEE